MDYVVGSVAALISGNVTPNRPKVLKTAITPIKHPPSPNVTPKSQVVDDRSIFLSPTLQKKKAIVKKSPKRIFQNPDPDVTDESIVSSPKANKVKKHLHKDLTDESTTIEPSVYTPKKKKQKSQVIEDADPPDSGNETLKENSLDEINVSPKKTSRNAISFAPGNDSTTSQSKSNNLDNNKVSKKKKKRKHMVEENAHQDSGIAILKDESTVNPVDSKTKRKLKSHVTQKEDNGNIDNNKICETIDGMGSKKKKKRKKSTKTTVAIENGEVSIESVNKTNLVKSKKNKGQTYVNPNAITSKDSDSEHDSDNDIESETEQSNKEMMMKMNSEPAEESSDEEEQKETIVKKMEKNDNVVNRAEELKRTLFIGNVPFNQKCKKDIKKIFRKYGNIDSIRIRTVPVKDARTTPKVAVIKNEFHPERSTVNVYVKYSDPSSVEQALAENNTVLNGCHLRVSKSESTGEDHDPKCSIFVGNMPFALEDEALREKFEKCGEIDSVRIIRDRKTNAGKGFGYVNFKTKDGVELALAMSDEDLTIKNRILRVKRCTQVTQKHQLNNRRRHMNKHQERFGGTPSNKFTNKKFGQNEGQESGAYRRIANKRKSQDNINTGPPNKMQRAQSLDQPQKEKKARKEFVGMTAEKKKKQKFNKDQKKKKQLSEILTK